MSDALYRAELLPAIEAELELNDCPRPRARRGGAVQRWSVRTLVLVAMLMVFQPLAGLTERFANACAALARHRPDLGVLPTSYQGFIKALLPLWWNLLERCSAALRRGIEQHARAAGHWLREGWLLFAVDGTRLDCPRTGENRRAFPRAGREKSGPQLLLTILLHVGTGLVWACRIGSARASERRHLKQMLKLLPPECLLLADAGYSGYDMLRQILKGGRHFLVRVGRNLRLLTEQGYHWRREGNEVWLWSLHAQRSGRPPLKLRLITLEPSSRHPVYLLTDVRSSAALSVRQAGIFYRLRWGVEVFFRSLKQTLQRRKLLSRTPKTARCELGMTLLGLWLLGWLSVRAILAAGKDPLGLSLALALRQVRRMLLGPGGDGGAGWAGSLGSALKDAYRRAGRKASRRTPRKKKQKPAGRPRIRQLTAEQLQKGQALHAIYAA